MSFSDLQQHAAHCLAQDKYSAAIALYEQCIAAQPTTISNYWQLGLAKFLQGDEIAAQKVWLSGLEQGDAAKIELVQVLAAAAEQQIKLGYSQQAERIYRQILELEPNNVEVYKKLGNVFLQQGCINKAIHSYEQAFHLDTNYLDVNYIEVYNNMGIILEKQGQLENAIACYQQALSIDPNYIEAYKNLGIVFAKKGEIENALTCHQQALALDLTSTETYNNLGVLFRKKGELEKAIACYQQALNLNPNFPEAYNNLGVAFEEMGQYEKAKACYVQGIELDPNSALAHVNLALILLRAGEFKLGFAEYEWRLHSPHNLEYFFIKNLPQPLWDGSNFTGQTILLHAEQGLGDTIQFIRYVPLVAQLGGRVIVECHESLIRLLKTVDGIEQLVIKGEALPEFQFHAPLMSLPRILGTTIESVPSQVPYLAATESSISLKFSIESRLKVGIVWAGSPNNPIDSRRSCSLKDFFGLLSVPNISFYSLQKELREEELTYLSGKLSIQDLSTQLVDFADTAAAIAQLDLVITVDTAVAHVTGALNKPVWILLPFVADWRWMIGRSDSIWYPSMRLFRQQHPGNWAGLFKEVEKALQTIANTKKNATKKLEFSQGGGFKSRPSKKR